MINKHKGGGIISDLQNIQSELAYTTDDTYLFNYKNKERDLEKLLYKLSKYEKHCKKKRKNKIKKQKEIQEEEIQNIKIKKKQNKHSRKESEQKPKKEKIKKKITEKKTEVNETVDNVESEQKQKKEKKKEKKTKKKIKSEVKEILDNVESEEKTVNIKEMLKNNGIKTLSGGDNNPYFENIPNSLFIPIIGPILFENNKININNNNNLVNDLLLFTASHILNILELYCIIDLIINKDNITVDKLLVIFTVLVIRILSSISVYKKNQKDNLNLNNKKNNKKTDKENNDMNIFILSFIIVIPVFIVLFNIEKYEMSDNIILSLIITILFLPYLRLLYNNMNKNDFNNDTARWINITEKIICALIIFIIIKNNFEIKDILNFIKNINNTNEDKIDNINDPPYTDKKNESSYNDKKNNILLQNFNNLFIK